MHLDHIYIMRQVVPQVYIHSTHRHTTVIWQKYCRYDIKLYSINQLTDRHILKDMHILCLQCQQMPLWNKSNHCMCHLHNLKDNLNKLVEMKIRVKKAEMNESVIWLTGYKKNCNHLIIDNNGRKILMSIQSRSLLLL